MLRMRTHHSPYRALTTQQNPIDSRDHFNHPILKGLWKFWQFSCFYGDYVSQPLEHREKISIPSQKANS